MIINYRFYMRILQVLQVNEVTQLLESAEHVSVQIQNLIKSKHILLRSQPNHPQQSPCDQVTTTVIGIQLLHRFFIQNQRSRGKRSIHLLIIDNKHIELHDFVLNPLTTQSNISVQDVFVNESDRLLKVMTLTVFTKITQQQLLL